MPWSEVCQFCGTNDMWERQAAFTVRCLAVFNSLHTNSFTDWGIGEGVLGAPGESCVPLTHQSKSYRRFGLAWMMVTHSHAHLLLPAVLSISYRSLPTLTYSSCCCYCAVTGNEFHVRSLQVKDTLFKILPKNSNKDHIF